MKNAANELLKDTLIHLASSIVRAIRVPLKNFQNSIFVVPPASSGSLGDQALIQGLQDSIAHNDKIILKQILLTNFKQQKLKNKEQSPLFLNMNSRLSTLKLILSLITCRYFIVLGADIVDGRYDSNQSLFYIDLLNIASRSGVKSALLGFSFSGSPNRKVVEKLKNIDHRIKIFLRDPVSLERFNSIVGSLNASLVADIAFLMTPKQSPETTNNFVEWITNKKSMCNKNIIAGLNINSLTFKDSFDSSINRYALQVEEMLNENKNIYIVLLPHDFRDGQSDLKSLLTLVSNINKDLHHRLFISEKNLNAWDIKHISSHLDFVVTGRMHLAIASLGQGTPCVCISYIGKFEGLMKYFDLSEFIISPEEVMESNNLNITINKLIGNIQKLKLSISEALPEIKNASRKNISWMDLS